MYQLEEVSPLMKPFNTLDDFKIKNKTVLLRVDFNLPLDKNTLKILDTTRIKLVLPTINELHNQQAKIIILAHQGRQGSWDFISLQHHAQALENLLHKPVTFVNDIYGEHAQQTIQNSHNTDIIMLDNVRKFTGETDKKTAEEHAKTPLIQNLAPLADIFVNDAFAAAHRPQCSLIGFTELLPSCAGRLMEKELTTLEKAVTNPKKPSIYLFGGAKFSDTITTIERLLSNHTADTILLTGLPANAFLKAQDYQLGQQNEKTLLQEGTPEQFQEIKKVYNKYKNNIILPLDFAIEQNNKRKNITLQELPTNKPLFDIGQQTIKTYKEILNDAQTVFLSGPCGVFENPFFRKGTEEIFTHIAHLNAFSIVGGGHTVAAVEQLHLQSQFSHISTGGGSLEKFMMGEKLPVVEALKKAKNKHYSLTIHK